MKQLRFLSKTLNHTLVGKIVSYFTAIVPIIIKYFSFIWNFLFHNSHDIFDRQIIVLNQINQIES